MTAILQNSWLRAQWMYRAWRYRLRVERPEVLFMLRHLSPGQTAVDVGAHKGAFTYWMNRLVGPSGHVLAFEPIPQLAVYLRQVRDALRMKNLTVVESALSKQRDVRDLHLPESGHLGPATLADHTHSVSSVRVHTDTLDGFCQEHGHRPVHFIKCDVEGHELEVFQGAESILREDRPTLLFECADCFHEDGQIARVLPYLKDLGYRGNFFFRGQILPVSEFRIELHQAHPTDPDWCANFAFLPE
jgi:FkbM family methyltransferase